MSPLTPYPLELHKPKPPAHRQRHRHHRHKAHHPRRVHRVIGAALSQLGVPYVWGGQSPGRGFDCSGLVRWAFGVAGVSLPRTTWAQADRGIHVRFKNVRPGDVLFVNGEAHEGLYIGNGVMVHAPHTGDVVRRTSLRSFLGEGLDAVRRYVKKNGRRVP